MAELGDTALSSGSRTDEWIFELPSLGADMEVGTVLEWLVEPGDEVERGDVIARVDTEKSDIDVEIWRSGTVVDRLVELGTEIPVGAPLLLLRTPVDDRPGEPQPVAHTPIADSNAIDDEEVDRPFQRGDTTGPRRAGSSPLARRIAGERGISVETIHGSGPGGAVVAADVLGAPEPTIDSVQPDSGLRMRRAIAARMSRANVEIPHYHLELDVDVEPALGWLTGLNDGLPLAERILPAALLLKATAVAARAKPELNGHWIDDRFESSSDVNVAVAVALRGGGLVTPVIGAADTLALVDLMSALRDRVEGARRGSLRSSWTEGATLTVTNLGDHGADRVHGVIFPPQVALVGFGRIDQRPWVVDGRVEVRPIVTVSLSGDHRATDGATGSRFLHLLARQLQNPETLR